MRKNASLTRCVLIVSRKIVITEVFALTNFQRNLQKL